MSQARCEIGERQQWIVMGKLRIVAEENVADVVQADADGRKASQCVQVDGGGSLRAYKPGEWLYPSGRVGHLNLAVV